MKPGLRIDSLRVRRFGHFSELSLELGPGLHLMYGPNEAGKSTLLAFLRAMLFGFEKRGHPERYAPSEEDTPFGGELRLFTATGPLTVRRMATPKGRKAESLTVLGPDGEPLSEERLKDARGHVSRELYFDVFAFRLEELAGFEQLTEARGASDALVAASMRGARRLPEAMSALSKSAERLYKPSGTNPELNVKLRELEEVQEQLREQGNRPALYFAKRERWEALGGELVRLETRVQEDGRELERLERLSSALSEVTALGEARAELEGLPALETFPEGGETRLEEALQRGRNQRGDVARLVEKLSSTEAELERLSAPSPVHGREEALRAAVASYAEYSERIRALPARRAALRVKRRQVEMSLEELGLGVDGAGLMGLDLSAGARAGLESLSTRLEAEETGRKDSFAAWGRARSERERLDGVLGRLESELAELPDVRPSHVRQQQAGSRRMREVRGELERLGEKKEETRRQLEGSRHSGVGPGAPNVAVIPVWWVPAAAAIVVALAVGAWLMGGTAAGAMCLAGGLLLTGLVEVARRRVESARDAERAAQAARLRERQQTEERLRATLAGLAAREEVLHRELLTASMEAGLAPLATLADITVREGLLADLLEKAGRREVLLRERDTLRASHDVASRDERQAGETLRGHEGRIATLNAELAVCLASRKFPSGLPAPAALTLWRDASALRQRWQDVSAEDAAVSTDEATCAAVVTRLHELTQGLFTNTSLRTHAVSGSSGRDAPTGSLSLNTPVRLAHGTERPHELTNPASHDGAPTHEDTPHFTRTVDSHTSSRNASFATADSSNRDAPTEALSSATLLTVSSTRGLRAARVPPTSTPFHDEDLLSARTTESLVASVTSALDAARERETERRAVDERRRELREEKARLDTLRQSEDAALAALLHEGGGGDEETFRRRAVQARRYAELVRQTRELAQRIEARTGLSDAQVREALRSLGGAEGLRITLEQVRSRHSEAQSKLKDVLTEQGATRNQLEQWENDDLLSRLRIQEETLRAKVAELATRYAEDKLALALLNRARQRFEEEQQPRVVQLASEHFALLTEGRYRRVFIPAGDERELRVSDGQRDWSADQLSRGTREQLYLAFRLAVVRDFGETRGALPLIVDDILVNFDPTRARGAIHLLARLAEQQQVIAFTCHPWLRTLFEAEGARLLVLDSHDASTARRAG
ncbi:AAA family ATPase [Myxococcus sp. K38C18041901]|uniref:AAA family ATPase n=1 Tax=Myxococcus guangdongensis TaxID=2906760 RepID=UPI0020A78049|nr:AAA family ATPase [Myxococcus guangdongensis]MCP3065681.1 AAA family ATPase [Myxococcus guangdongensis]